ncbi:MAG TPA: hypothetical protein VK447_11900 [Myxococcaceae bacterium]|nr:hypothetical protein [Myxococcaceae bacterium]
MASISTVLGAWALGAVLAAGGGKPAANPLQQKAEKLAREAKALANPKGCKKLEQCELAGFGHKPCGGPNAFIAYCSVTTKKDKLKEKLDELEKAEREWQAAEGIMSTCSLQRRPQLKLVGGVCQAR